MKERLGKNPYKVAISREEISLVNQVRERTGVPMQTWIRRVIREQAEKELAEQSVATETPSPKEGDPSSGDIPSSGDVSKLEASANSCP